VIEKSSRGGLAPNGALCSARWHGDTTAAFVSGSAYCSQVNGVGTFTTTSSIAGVMVV